MRSGGDLTQLINKNVCILTFGCTYNHGDSRKLENILISQGCRIVLKPEGADALVVNTCTVVGKTERKMIRLLKKYRAMPLYVTGCMPLVQKEEVLATCTPVFIHPDTITEESRKVPHHVHAEVGIVQIGRGCLRILHLLHHPTCTGTPCKLYCGGDSAGDQGVPYMRGYRDPALCTGLQCLEGRKRRKPCRPSLNDTRSSRFISPACRDDEPCDPPSGS